MTHRQNNLYTGWMPGYLIMNMTGPKKYRGKNANHFSPTAAFFKPEEYWLIVQTNVAFFMASALISFCIYTYGKTFFRHIPHRSVSQLQKQYNNNSIIALTLQVRNNICPEQLIAAKDTSNSQLS